MPQSFKFDKNHEMYILLQNNLFKWNLVWNCEVKMVWHNFISKRSLKELQPKFAKENKKNKKIKKKHC